MAVPILNPRAGPAARTPSGLKTYSTLAVPGLTTERCTCQAAGCPRYTNGWTVRLDETLRAGQVRADYIRRVSRRHYVETTDESQQVTVFTFEPLTPCFHDVRDRRAHNVFGIAAHTRQIRQHLHLVSEGSATDVAAQLTTRQRAESPIRTHTRPRDWAEDLAESWNTMADTINGHQ